MSPSGKAPDFDSGIRRFESCHPSHVGARRALLRFYFFLPDPLAQLAEQLPFKQWVWSSNLQRVTKKQPRGCFFACPMEIRRLAMRQSGGLSLARPMPDCLHQKHLAICRIANSIAPSSATPIFLQRKNANDRKRVTKKQPRGCFFACPMEIRRLAVFERRAIFEKTS